MLLKKSLEKSWLVISCLLMTLSSVILFPALSWHDQQRCLQILFLCVSIVVAVFSDRFIVIRRNFIFLIIAILVLGAFSSALAEFSSPWAWLEWSWWGANFAMFYCVVRVSSLDIKATKIFVGLALMSWVFLYVIKILMGLLAVYANGLPLNSRILIDGFSNSRFFGQYATVVWPILVALAVDYSRSRYFRLCMTLAASFLMLAILISQTRGTFYGVASGAVFLFLLKNVSGWGRSAAISILLGFILYLILILVPGWLDWIDISRLELRFDNFGLSGRNILWHDALDIVLSHPWLGIGPMGFSGLHHIYGAHPHSSVVQIAVEWGVPALILVLILVVMAGVELLRVVHERKRDVWGAGLFVALCGSLVQSLVDGVLVMPLSQMALVGCAGLVVAWVRERNEVICWTSSTFFHRLSFGCIGLIFFASFYVTASLQGNGMFDRGTCESWASDQIRPRFWRCGAIISPALSEAVIY